MTNNNGLEKRLNILIGKQQVPALLFRRIVNFIEQENKQAQIEIYERLRLKCGDYINEEWIEEELNELKNED